MLKKNYKLRCEIKREYLKDESICFVTLQRKFLKYAGAVSIFVEI